MSDLGPSDPRPDGLDDADGHDDRDELRRTGLPPGSSTRGAPDDIDGNVRHERPFEDAPGEGQLAPGSDNPPPASVDPTGLAGEQS
jgi:hypothetical protein